MPCVFLFARKVRSLLCFYTTLFCCPYAHLLSRASPHSLSFRLSFCFCNRQFDIFFFSPVQQPILLSFIVFSRLGSSSYQSRFLSSPWLPFLLLLFPFFYFSFCTAYQTSLPTYRAYLYEGIESWMLRKTQYAERTREKERSGGM